MLGTIAYLVRSEAVRFLREQLDRALKAEAIATDRLLHAWRDDKAIIPPRPPEPVPPPEPLPAELQAEVSQWESPESRAVLEGRMRAMLGRGMSTPAILMSLDNEHPA